jgi:transcriptional regulator with XRE-family HTH domain
MEMNFIAADQLGSDELGEWLSRWRGFCKLSLKNLERYTGIPSSRLSRVEAGEVSLTSSERFVVVDYLGCEVRKVIEGAAGRVFIPQPLADEAGEALVGTHSLAS